MEAERQKLEFLAVGEACEAIHFFLSTPAVKGETIDGSGFSSKGGRPLLLRRRGNSLPHGEGSNEKRLVSFLCMVIVWFGESLCFTDPMPQLISRTFRQNCTGASTSGKECEGRDTCHSAVVSLTKLLSEWALKNMEYIIGCQWLAASPLLWSCSTPSRSGNEFRVKATTSLVKWALTLGRSIVVVRSSYITSYFKQSLV